MTNEQHEVITVEELHRRGNSGELHPETEAALDAATLLLIQFIVEDMQKEAQERPKSGVTNE